jgi:DNA-binding transcriptional LysR family regulator
MICAKASTKFEFLADPTASKLKVACTEPLAKGFVQAAIARLPRQYPNVCFEVVAADPVTLRTRELRERRVEFVMIPMTGLALGEDTAVEILFEDRQVVIVPRNSKWARRHDVKLADLMCEPWVLPPRGTPIDDYITQGFHAAYRNLAKLSSRQSMR